MNLTEICKNKLIEKNLHENERYKKRLEFELKCICGLDEDSYFLEIYQKGHKYETNENNLLICWLLDLVSDFDIEKEPAYDYGDLPDIDIDYPTKIRSYLKEEYSPKEFGKEKICGICTYGRLGIRSSILDMARVLGLDHHEAQEITKSLPVKDEEGDALTWEEAVEIVPRLKEYFDKNPELAESAKKISNRIRSIGVHASGLIISNIDLKNSIPLVMPKQDGPVVSAWVEGQMSSDLSTVGLVKFDFLGSDTMEKIGEACHHAKILLTRYKEAIENNTLENDPFLNSLPTTREMERKATSISAFPGYPSWTDPYYLNDPKSLKIADQGDLKTTFQFDGSNGIRRLAKDGGVSRFEDIIAYLSIFRPSTLKCGTHKVYCERNKGRDKTTCHPAIQDILGSTNGIIIYQEQCMKIFNKVGKIPLKNCTELIKAISKKKIEKFAKYKEMFIKNGTEFLGSKKEAEDMFSLLEAFAGYGFNKSHAAGYGTVTARQLYLKANYPTCHFPAFLNTFNPTGEDDYVCLKEYLSEMKRYGIKILRPDINKSKYRLICEDNLMYYSFSKIKGIGEIAAKKIEENQPYENITDFLQKNGTEAKVVQSLIGLCAFGKDRLKQIKYFYAYRDWNKMQIDAKKKIESLKEKLLPYGHEGEVTEESIISTFENFHSEDIKKDKRTLNGILKTFRLNKERIETPYPDYDTFQDDEPMEDKELESIMSGPQEKADLLYLGFTWDNQMEKALGRFSEHTFANLDNCEKSTANVEVYVEEVNKKMSKNNNEYYSVKIQDIIGVSKFVTIWQSDYNQFKEELVPGKILSMNIKKPEEGSKFRMYTLAPTANRWKMPAKNLDNRIVTLATISYT